MSACDCGHGQTEIMDAFGEVAARFIKIRDGFYGGKTGYSTDADAEVIESVFPGPHMIYGAPGLLQAIGRLALETERRKLPCPFRLRGQYGSEPYGSLSVERVMSARQAAFALGIGQDEVRAAFADLVAVPESEPAT